VKNVPGRKTDVNDATWLADLLAHGLIRGSFVPGEETQVLRSLLRTRKQLVRERSSHIQRLQKTLEDANIKLDSAITDIIGLSGRRMLEALIAGETDPTKLAALAHPRVKAPPEQLREALRGRSWRTTASCCGCTFSRSTPLMPLLARSIARWKDVLPPFASPSNC
jgi:transposase